MIGMHGLTSSKKNSKIGTVSRKQLGKYREKIIFQNNSGKRNCMKTLLKRRLQTIIACVCVGCFLCPVPKIYASDLDSLENESSSLRNNLDSINSELLDIGTQIAENENEIEAINNDITKTEEQLAIAKNNEDDHYADMKIRIQYMYENSGESMLGLIFSAEDFPDFLNKVQFVQSVSQYDRDMFKELQELRYTIEKEEEHLKEQQEECVKLEKKLKGKRKELKEKAESASADLQTLEARIQDIREQQAAEQAAREKAAKEEAAKASKTNGTPQKTDSGGNSSGGGQESPSGSGYDYPSGNGVLTKSKGVNYYNGHRETYYSQRVLPGHGLSIPGRHVAADGTIRDGNGNLCLASSDYPKGTKVMTSLGMGVVYDTGCASGTIDIYTDW